MADFRLMLSTHVREHFLQLVPFWMLLLIAARAIHYGVALDKSMHLKTVRRDGRSSSS